MLATGAISVVLVTLLHVVSGLRELVEKEEPNFEWDAFLPSILVVLVSFKEFQTTLSNISHCIILVRKCTFNLA